MVQRPDQMWILQQSIKRLCKSQLITAKSQLIAAKNQLIAAKSQLIVYIEQESADYLH